MKLNTIIQDPDGRQAKLITQPIPGRSQQLVTLLYPDGRGRVVDLAKCQVPEEQKDRSKA